MDYGKFEEVLPQFPMGRFNVNSNQLVDLLSHEGCTAVSVRVLNLGTVNLDREEMIHRLQQDFNPRLDDIHITCIQGEIIIDNPSHGCDD